MIQEDVIENRAISTGFGTVIATGRCHICRSQCVTLGMKGTGPMMRTLQKAGYDIELHGVIVVGHASSGLGFLAKFGFLIFFKQVEGFDLQ